MVARVYPKWGEHAMVFVILYPQKAEKWKGRHARLEKDLKTHA